MSKLEVVDLFSGLGGFSEAFLNRGHNVERYDNDPQFKKIPYTWTVDVRDLEPDDIAHADIILASFPCNHFSPMSSHYHWPKMQPTEETKKVIVQLKETLTLITRANPKYWILENPVGLMRRAIGKPVMLTHWAAWGAKWLKPTHLWGKLPPINWKNKSGATWEKAPRGSKSGVQDGKTSSAIRALIPYEFSMAVCLATEGISPQQTLERYL